MSGALKMILAAALVLAAAASCSGPQRAPRQPLSGVDRPHEGGGPEPSLRERVDPGEILKEKASESGGTK